jgi:Fungal specific transcription factor domain
MGACAQLAQALGLHRDTHGLRLHPVVREERLKVFWVCYVMDKTISMGVGRSSALHDFDCDVPLPSNNFDELPGTVDEHGTSILGPFINQSHTFFVHNIRLAQIISKVYRELYSAQAVARHTIDSLADVVGDLDEELMHWRNTIPEEYRPEHDIEWKLDTLHQHVLHLHLGYYNCLYNIHRSIFSLRFGPAPGSYFTPDRPLPLLRRNRIYGSAALSIGSARTSLRLVLALTEKFPGLLDLRIWSIYRSPRFV